MTAEKPELDWLKRWALYTPEAMALECADTSRAWTYAECYQKSLILAQQMVDDFDIEPGDRVAALACNELEYVLLFFALQRLDAILVPINFRLTPREVNHILTDSQPKLLFYQESYQNIVSQLQELPFVIPFEGADGLIAKLNRVTPSLPKQPMQGKLASPCMILYTSGTTGAPKGAIITNKMLFWNSLNTSLRLNLTGHDRTIIFLPFFHTSGWNVLTTPILHRGGHVIFLKKFDPDRVLSICAEKKVTILFGVPTTMDMMSRASHFDSVDLSRLRYAIVGGEPMSVKSIRTWGQKGIPIRQGYGLTEFGPNVFSLNEQDAVRKIGSIGFPNFYIEARIVDEQGQELGSNEIGELILRGPSCMEGYWRQPQATQKSIRDGWLHTGDLVRRDSEGYYYVVGRKKEMYISGGENVYPAEVEKVIHILTGIKEVAVVGVSDEKWGEVGKAFITIEPDSHLTETAVLDHCRKNLAKYKVPKYIQFMNSLPKGDSGKILKRRLLQVSPG